MNRNLTSKIQALLIGVIVIKIGVLLYLFNAGILAAVYKPIIFSWQALLAVIGCIMLVDKRSWTGGAMLILIGAIFLLPKLDLPGLRFTQGYGWALIFIVMGFLILCKAIFGKNCCHTHREHNHVHHQTHSRWSRDEAGYIERNYVFGGGKEKIDAPDFKGGEINCVFGGLDLDLSDAQLAEGIHTLEINTVFGGVNIYVPTHWRVEIRQTRVFGSFEDRRNKPYFDVEENKTLVIIISAIFGGGEIRSK